MELRSGRYSASGEARRRIVLILAQPVVPDHISALPDDLLLLVLDRLGCVAAAARTGVLARRWRGLWTLLPRLHFRDVPFVSVAACFGRATSTSLSLSTGNDEAELDVPPSVGGECLFPTLTTLDLYGYYAADGLAALVAHCPRLLVLRYAGRRFRHYNRGDHDISIHSPSLRELVVKERTKVCRVDIVAPALEQLSMSFIADDSLTVSVVAPVAEKVTWRCHECLGVNTGLGCWDIEKLSLTASPSTAPPKTRRPLLRIDALSGMGHFHDMPRIEGELEKHLRLQVGVDLSTIDLELRITPRRRQVYGALVFCILGMQHVLSATRKFKLALLPNDHIYQRWGKCKSCELVDWRSQTICMTKLQEVEIDGFQGDDHEFDFLELVFRCAPRLRRMAVKWSSEVDAPSDAKILNVFKAHPSVECYVSSSVESMADMHSEFIMNST